MDVAVLVFETDELGDCALEMLRCPLVDARAESDGVVLPEMVEVELGEDTADSDCAEDREPPPGDDVAVGHEVMVALGEREDAADAEATAELVGVSVAHVEALCAVLPELHALALGLELSLSEPVTVTVPLGEEVLVSDTDGDPVALGEEEARTVNVPVGLDVAETVRFAEREGEIVALRERRAVAVTLSVVVSVADGVSERDEVTVSDRDAEDVVEPVCVALEEPKSDGLEEMDGVPESDVVTDGDKDTDFSLEGDVLGLAAPELLKASELDVLPDTDLEGDAAPEVEGENVPGRNEALKPPLTVASMVDEAVAEGDRELRNDAVVLPETVDDSVPAGVKDGLGEALGAEEALPESVLEPVAVPEFADDADVDGLALEVSVTEPVTEKLSEPVEETVDDEDAERVDDTEGVADGQELWLVLRVKVLDTVAVLTPGEGDTLIEGVADPLAVATADAEGVWHALIERREVAEADVEPESDCDTLPDEQDVPDGEVLCVVLGDGVTEMSSADFVGGEVHVDDVVAVDDVEPLAQRDVSGVLELPAVIVAVADNEPDGVEDASVETVDDALTDMDTDADCVEHVLAVAVAVTVAVLVPVEHPVMVPEGERDTVGDVLREPTALSVADWQMVVVCDALVDRDGLDVAVAHTDSDDVEHAEEVLETRGVAETESDPVEHTLGEVDPEFVPEALGETVDDGDKHDDDESDGVRDTEMVAEGEEVALPDAEPLVVPEEHAETVPVTVAVDVSVAEDELVADGQGVLEMELDVRPLLVVVMVDVLDTGAERLADALPDPVAEKDTVALPVRCGDRERDCDGEVVPLLVSDTELDADAHAVGERERRDEAVDVREIVAVLDCVADADSEPLSVPDPERDGDSDAVIVAEDERVCARDGESVKECEVVGEAVAVLEGDKS